MKQALITLIVCAIAASVEARPGQPATQRDRSVDGSRVYKLEELTWPQIDALDRERTLFILPMGMIEQHGPHLPVGADTIGVTYEANAGRDACQSGVVRLERHHDACHQLRP